MLKTTVILISALLILTGCASSTTNQHMAPNVTSTPSGALIYANGLEIGKTPLKRNLYDEFPAGWKNSIYQAQGVLMIKMKGCKDYALKVNDRILSEPIHAELECSEAGTAEKPAADTTLSATPLPTQQEDTEARLGKLEALYKKGLVTTEEYKKTRERILSEI